MLNFASQLPMSEMKSTIALHSKLPTTGVSIFAKMTALANEYGALNLAQGFPDFGCDSQLIDLVSQAMVSGHNQYAPMAGVPELRQAIAEKTEQLYGAVYNPTTEITVTAGATQAIFTAITALIREQDEVIIFTPAYDCYEPAITLAGGKPIHIQLKQPDFHIDWDEVKNRVNRKTRMIILNSPHNPSGATLSKSDLKSLAALVGNTDIIILSDEVYEHIVFDGAMHESIARHPNLAKRAIIVSSFGKTYHNTGWKLGYAVAPEILMNEFRKVHQFNVFSVNTPVQHALAKFIKNEASYTGLSAFYQQKRDFFVNAVAGSKFKCVQAKGTYFQLLDYSAVSELKDTDFADLLTKNHKLASIPVSVFYHSDPNLKLLRFCFAKSEETMQQAAEILHKL